MLVRSCSPVRSSCTALMRLTPRISLKNCHCRSIYICCCRSVSPRGRRGVGYTSIRGLLKRCQFDDPQPTFSCYGPLDRPAYCKARPFFPVEQKSRHCAVVMPFRNIYPSAMRQLRGLGMAATGRDPPRTYLPPANALAPLLVDQHPIYE